MSFAEKPLAEKLGKVGVIFDSGAFYGAFGMGIAKALWKRGIRPVAIGGVSVGALNAAKLAENNSLEGVQELEKIWLDIEKQGPSSVFAPSSAFMNVVLHRNSPSIYRSTELAGLVNKVSAQKLIKSETLFECIVTDKINDCRKIISNRDPMFAENPDTIKDYIRASASVPGAFPPVLINNGVYADGFVFGLLLESFAKFGCDTIFVAMNDLKLPKHKPNYVPEKWDIEIFRGMRSLQTEINYNSINEFLEKHSDFHPFDYEAEEDDPPILKGLRKIKNWLATTIVEGQLDGIRHQLVVTFPHCYIPDFYPTKFKKVGHISLASQKSEEEGDRILNGLEKQ